MDAHIDDATPRQTDAQVQKHGVGFRIIAVLMMFAVTLLVITAAGEVIIRLFVPVSDVAYYFWDPVLGPRRQPHQSGQIIREGMQGRFTFNAQGWNHPEDYVIPKPPGTRRVCLIGDSYVEAIHVKPHETLFTVAERAMNTSNPDQPTQWYAFGCSGMGTDREYLTLRHYTLDYRPDVVVLLFVANDPFDCSPYLLPANHVGPTFLLDADDELELMPAKRWRRAGLKIWASKSALARYFLLDKNLFRRQGRMGEFESAVDRGEFRSLAGASMSMDDRGRKTWQVIEKLLRACRDDCRARGVSFLLAFGGNVNRLEAQIEGRSYEPPAAEEDPFCLDPRKRNGEMGESFLRPIAARLEIPYLDLTEALLDEMKRTGHRYDFPRDKHYSAAGHQAAGEALAEWVSAVLDETVEARTAASPNAD